MADNTIALQSQAPSGLTSIGQMLNFAGGIQDIQAKGLALEKARQTFEADVAQRKAESSRAETEARVSAGTEKTRIAEQQATTERAQIAARIAAQALTQDQRGIIAGVVGTLGRAGVEDPKIYKAELENLKKVNPDNKALHTLIDSFGTIIDNHPKYVKLSSAAIGSSQYLLTPPQAQSGLTPSAGTIGMGGTVNQVINTPSVMGSQPSVAISPTGTAVTMGPQGVESIEVGPDKQQYIITRSPTGTILGTRPLAGGPVGGTGAGAGIPQFRPGDAEAIPGLSQEREAARTILSAAPISHTTNRGILDELEKVISTGQTGGILAKAASIAGAIPGAKAPETAASAYDLIGKYTERNALEAAKAMGPGTNAGLEAAIKANGSAAYNPTALRRITHLNDAIVTGSESYQPGLEKAIAAAGNRGVLAKREYDQKWAQNFEPEIFELYNAKKSGNKAEVERIVKELGPQGVARIQIKSKALQSLSATGKLPNE